MPSLFDTYIMVDWSAAVSPKRGADSIWLSVQERRDAKLTELALSNPATRQAAVADLLDILSDQLARGLRVLVGFDFSFGYPKDFAAALDLKQADWAGVWKLFAGLIQDQPDNANNRFEVAARLNEKISGTTGPFWGCPKNRQTAFLESTKPYLNLLTNEMRLCEQRIKGIKSVWQLLGTGCVGSQVMMGIPRLEELRRHPWLDGQVKVWPFETGLNANDLGQITFAEIYPSQLKNLRTDLVKDAAQVQGLALHYAALDGQGDLAALFEGDPSLTPEERKIVCEQEGWVLGVGATARDQALNWLATYIKTPNAIYEKSQEMIEQEIDVSAFPHDMQDVAIRMIHACGDINVRDDIAFSDGAAAIGRSALASGCPVFVDVEMVSHGIIRKRLPAQNDVVCTLNDLRTPDKAKDIGTTRSAAAVEFWGDRLKGAVVVIGNAPTALFHLIEGIRDGRFEKPALIVGCPVGFVGAMESKETLIALSEEIGVPYIALRGRRGGSAIAASALNALAKRGITQ